MAQSGEFSQTLRAWGKRMRAVAAQPVSRAAKQAVANLLRESAFRRAAAGVAPDGRAFQPLSPVYAARKAKRGRNRGFWKYSGASLGRLSTFLHDDGVRLVINTPYSRLVHDGGTITRRYKPRQASSIQGHKRQKAAARKRSKAHVERLKGAYGRRTKAAALKAHEKALKAASHARRMARAEGTLAPAAPRRRASKQTLAALRAGLASRRPARTSWAIRYPPRPILGISEADAAGVRRIWTTDIKKRLEGGVENG